MIKINYSIWPYIKPNGQVAIRVRWNSKQYTATFITGVYADPNKWDTDGHKAKRGTKHFIRNMEFDYSDINERISDYQQEIEIAFDRYSLKNTIPTTDELKNMVNKALGRSDNTKKDEFIPVKKKSMEQMLDWLYPLYFKL